MAEKDIVELPEIYKVQAFKYANQDDYLNKMYGTDGKITNREKRQAKKYWMSDKRIIDYDNHNSLEKNKFYQSMSDFIKAAQQRQALSASTPVQPVIPVPTNPVIPINTVPVEHVSTPEIERQDVDPLTPNWLKIATDNGFANLDEVKDFQKKVGLEETGQLNEESLAKLNWYNHMKGLDYSENPLQNGQVAFFNDGTMYYNNGRMQSSDGTMSSYDYKTLSKIQRDNVQQNYPIVTKENLMHHKNFRKHRRGTESVTIDGKTYPVFVTKDLKN